MSATDLWYTDRSRYECGVGFCPRARFLNYHHPAGQGYGIEPVAQSLPLATGTYLHQPVAALLDLASHDVAIDRNHIRAAVALALSAYRVVVEQRGILHIEGEGQELQHLLEEQCCLIEGLVWVFALYHLPQILKEYRIVEVEQESVYMAVCTCGLGQGIGSEAHHVRRGCTGVAFQARPDFITQRISDGQYGYHELKTAAEAGKRYQDSWETRIQFSSTRLPVEEQLGCEISHSWLWAFVKGRRDREKSVDGEYAGPRRQQSFLTYLFHRLANPPYCDHDWQPSWFYLGTDGKRHTLSKKKGESYNKEPVWPQQFPGIPDGWSPVEYWVDWLGVDICGPLIVPIGPIPRKGPQIDGFVRELIGEEDRWRAAVWALYELGEPWGTPAYEQSLDELAPRSYQCHNRYGSPCGYIPLCFYHDGWQDPLGSGKFVQRTPHHEPEKRQAIERGLIPREGLAEEIEE